jgi:hypothetical protein
MKSKLILVFCWLFGLILAGCDNGTTSQTTKFEGTWKGGWGGNINVDVTFKFTGYNWDYSSTDTAGRYVSKDPLSGTFTFDDEKIVFTTSGNDSASWTITYTLTNNELEFTGSTGNNKTNVALVTLRKQN